MTVVDAPVALHVTLQQLETLLEQPPLPVLEGDVAAWLAAMRALLDQAQGLTSPPGRAVAPEAQALRGGAPLVVLHHRRNPEEAPSTTIDSYERLHSTQALPSGRYGLFLGPRLGDLGPGMPTYQAIEPLP